MSTIKLFCTILFSLFFVLMIKCDFSKQSIYIKGVRCNSSHPNVFQNFSCYAKSFNRTFSTINAFAYLREPQKEVFLEVKLFYKYGTIYREVMHTPLIDWCKLMKEETSNVMVKQLLSLIRDSVPSLVHECPYKEAVLKNVNVKSQSLLSLIPAGDYKMIFWAFDGKDNNLGVLNIIGSMISPLKESFG